MVCTGTIHPGPLRIFRLLLDYYFAILIIHGITGDLFVASFARLSVFIVSFLVAGTDPIKNVAGWDGKIK